MSVEQTIVDLVLADLEGAFTVDHSTFKYFRPPAILPDDCPALLVWLDSEVSHPRTTEWFGYDYYVGIAWYEAVVEQAETLVPDVDKALALLDALDIIKQRVEAMAKAGLGVSGEFELTPAEVRYVELPRGLNLETGLTQGYSVLVRVSTLEA